MPSLRRRVVAQDGSQAVSGSGARLPKWLMIARSPGCGLARGKISEAGMRASDSRSGYGVGRSSSARCTGRASLRGLPRLRSPRGCRGVPRCRSSGPRRQCGGRSRWRADHRTLPIRFAARYPAPRSGAPDVEFALEGCDPLRHSLLRYAELVGRVLQLSELGYADERSHRLGIH